MIGESPAPKAWIRVVAGPCRVVKIGPIAASACPSSGPAVRAKVAMTWETALIADWNPSVAVASRSAPVISFNVPTRPPPASCTGRMMLPRIPNTFPATVPRSFSTSTAVFTASVSAPDSNAWLSFSPMPVAKLAAPAVSRSNAGAPAAASCPSAVTTWPGTFCRFVRPWFAPAMALPRVPLVARSRAAPLAPRAIRLRETAVSSRFFRTTGMTVPDRRCSSPAKPAKSWFWMPCWKRWKAGWSSLIWRAKERALGASFFSASSNFLAPAALVSNAAVAASLTPAIPSRITAVACVTASMPVTATAPAGAMFSRVVTIPARSGALVPAAAPMAPIPRLTLPRIPAAVRAAPASPRRLNPKRSLSPAARVRVWVMVLPLATKRPLTSRSRPLTSRVNRLRALVAGPVLMVRVGVLLVTVRLMSADSETNRPRTSRRRPCASREKRARARVAGSVSPSTRMVALPTRSSPAGVLM